MATQKVVSREKGLDVSDYKWGFTIDIESDVAPKGLNEDIIHLISQKKGEPQWMLDWRLKAYPPLVEAGQRGAQVGQRPSTRPSTTRTSSTTHPRLPSPMVPRTWTR